MFVYVHSTYISYAHANATNVCSMLLAKAIGHTAAWRKQSGASEAALRLVCTKDDLEHVATGTCTVNR